MKAAGNKITALIKTKKERPGDVGKCDTNYVGNREVIPHNTVIS
jgi:hypothetical protein